MSVIAYDLRYAADHFTGIGRHAYCLLELLLALPGPERYAVLWNPALRLTRFDLDPIRRHPRVTWFERSIPPLAPLSPWRVGRWLGEIRPAVYFDPFYFRPLGAPCPSVVTVHDVWPLRFPYGFPAWKRALFRLSLRDALRARLIVTSSGFSREEITRLAPVDPARVRVVRLGVPPPRRAIEPRRPDRMTGRPFALAVGLNYPYKNLTILAEAWAILGESAPLDLVAAGREIDRYPRLAEMAAARGVTRATVLGHVSEAELEWLYHHATLLVFPTTYEGFGFPLVEAFAHGLPAIAADIPPLRELDDGATHFVPPRDAAAWARAVAGLAADGAERARMRAQGLKRAAELDYGATARATLELLREAAA